MKKSRILTHLILILITIITVYDSVNHHRVLARDYGEIANIFVPIIAAGSFLIGAFVSLLFQWGIDIIQFEHILKLLPLKEGKVLSVLFNRKQITQSDLSIETNLSAVAISRIISTLEKRGIVTKKPIENTNLITSKLYRMAHSTKILKKLPGVSERRILIAISAVFIFGLSLSLLNSFHVNVLGHPLEFSLYLIAIEFFALGGLVNILLRERIYSIQFNKILDILPADERNLLKIIYLKKTTTQKELVDTTGIYKMKVSRILRKFENKGIIERRPYGYTNRVILKI